MISSSATDIPLGTLLPQLSASQRLCRIRPCILHTHAKYGTIFWQRGGFFVQYGGMHMQADRQAPS